MMLNLGGDCYISRHLRLVTEIAGFANIVDVARGRFSFDGQKNRVEIGGHVCVVLESKTVVPLLFSCVTTAAV